MKILEVFQKLGIQYRESGHEHCRPGWIQLDCPWCNRPDHFRLGYNISKGYVHCWACGPHRISPTLCELSKRSIGEIHKLLNGVILERVPTNLRTVGRLQLPKGLEDELRPAIRKYLKGRGFDPDQIQRIWGIKCLGPYAGELCWRIWIPIYLNGEVVSWTTRSISDQHKLRYRSARKEQEKYDHKTLLYGEDFTGTSVVVHEGPLDVWATGPGAVATFGTAYSRSQLVRLARFVVRGVCLDNEPDGQRRAKKLVQELALYDGETYNVTLNAKDAGAASRKEITELRRRFLREG